MDQAELPQKIQQFTREGWRVESQTDTQAQSPSASGPDPSDPRPLGDCLGDCGPDGQRTPDDLEPRRGGEVRRVGLLAVVLALAFASSAQAAPLLTGPEARAALVEWSLDHGMERAEVQRCQRKARPEIRCILRETGWWDYPADKEWTAGAESLYDIRRNGDVIAVEWGIPLFNGPPCTEEPGYSNQCPPEG